MGYKKDTGMGLGAQGQGRSEPIDVKMRIRRRGLGAEIKGLEPSFSVTWDEGQEEVKCFRFIDLTMCNLPNF